MKTTIDAAGRLVIPKDIRREAGLRPGMPLEVRLREGRIEIEPAPLAVKLVTNEAPRSVSRSSFDAGHRRGGSKRDAGGSTRGSAPSRSPSWTPR